LKNENEQTNGKRSLNLTQKSEEKSSEEEEKISSQNQPKQKRKCKLQKKKSIQSKLRHEIVFVKKLKDTKQRSEKVMKNGTTNAPVSKETFTIPKVNNKIQPN
jgi:hypothetical protein